MWATDLTYLGSHSRVTECLAPKYEPTGERMTNRVAWLAGPSPRVGSVPIIVGLKTNVRHFFCL